VEAVKTPMGVRAFIRRSKVPIADWARALGVSYSSLYRLVQGQSGMQEGPLMQRAMRMVQALEEGVAHWERGAQANGRGTYRLKGACFSPTILVTYRVNFLGGSIQRIEGVDAL
jgi:hypothetical protein